MILIKSIIFNQTSIYRLLHEKFFYTHIALVSFIKYFFVSIYKSRLININAHKKRDTQIYLKISFLNRM